MADAGRVQPGLQGGKVVPDRPRDGRSGGRLDRAGQAVDEGIRVLQGRSLKQFTDLRIRPTPGVGACGSHSIGRGCHPLTDMVGQPWRITCGPVDE